ncbi:MAG: hypothetical protein MUO40_06955 [Anaerolineaceae bacterium]|nr:hypothetical protein [Anaerolineaceae bacterium]
MKKTFIFLISIIAFVLLGFFSVAQAFSNNLRVDSIQLVSPETCPASGCAAGQRLNFQIEFTANPQITSKPNTLLCVAALKDGQSGLGINPWADFSSGRISNSGLVSNLPYTSGDIDNICTNTISSSETLLTSVSATLLDSVSEKLELVLRINRTTDISGLIKAYVFELQSNGSTWNLSNTLVKEVSVSQPSLPVYVAETVNLCSNFSPCYVNSGDDLPDGLGTGLKDAVDAYTQSVDINIISTYPIKSQTVLINKPHNISGLGNSKITYNGASCTLPMLKLTNGGSLKYLTINDGTCSSVSRNLIHIDSATPVFIESNTLNNGYDAITIKDNSGDVLIQFNHISENIGYAIKHLAGGNSGTMNAVANNIFNNGYGYEVDCQNKGIVDHNYWGSSTLPSSAAVNCTITPGKLLGASIKLANSGVDAVRKTVTNNKISAFDGKISFKRSSGPDFDIYLINHGYGSIENIPFINSGTEPITACSNFYDVFVAQGSAPSNLALSFKYDLNSSCLSLIESTSYCDQSNSIYYPLWWYDPYSNVTDLWDKTGEAPKGYGAAGVSGQTTTCDLVNHEITVNIDASGRPNFSDDLNFTPFVVGIPLPSGIQLTSFTATFSLTRVDLKWITSSENNISGYHILRSDSSNGTYNRISEKIPAIGNAFIGGIYTISDYNIIFTKNYFYKLEVIGIDGNTIEILGPISVLTATATPTATATRTITPTFTSSPFRTNTPYIYKSPTKFIPSLTPTKRNQTPVYKSPTPFYTRTQSSPLTPSLSETNDRSSTQSQTEEFFPGLVTPSSQTTGELILTPNLTQIMTNTPARTGDATKDSESANNADTGYSILRKSDRYTEITWVALMAGAAISLLFLLLLGWIFIRSHLT